MGTAIVLGMVTGLGLTAIIVGLSPAPVRLGDALAALDRRPTSSFEAPPRRRTLHLPLTATQQRLLSLQDRSVQDFFVEKLILGVAGLLLPGLWVLMQLITTGRFDAMPMVASPVLGLAGFFLPDLNLRRGARQQRRAMGDAMHTYFDLVALERLANASATQAATAAAAVSEAPLFRRISAGLERARMEQVPPWDELRAIADEWDAPELADFADVMQLEEQGAGVADVLQARVKELRDAQLTRVKIEASEASEQMTLWMTIPAMLLGIAFLTPALLRITMM